MKVQFHHKRNYDYVKYSINDDYTGVVKVVKAQGGTTLALQIPTVEEFEAFAIKPLDHWGFYDSIELEFGMSKCSSEDNYNKKIGREITKGRMKPIVFWAKKHSPGIVILVATQGNFPELVLRKSPQGGRVYFVGVK